MIFLREVALLALQNRLETVALRFRRFHLGRSCEAFDPLLVITVKRTAIFAPDQFKDEVAVLRLFRQHMTPFIRRSDDPSVISGRTSLVAVNCRGPREPPGRVRIQ